MKVSVVVPTHDPDPGRLRRTLLGLCAQTLPGTEWETILVDNASTRFPAPDFFADCRPSSLAIVSAPELGLTAARRRGLAAARGDFVVLVDDDNVLAPDYLAQVARLFAAHPELGALGGLSLPEFEMPPPAWAAEFFPLLALRVRIPSPAISGLHRAAGGGQFLYPACAPIGAGMALRREAAAAWSAQAAAGAPSDRRGRALTSGGDNDIVLTLLHAGWKVGCFSELVLTHLIPAGRLDAGYLARLNRGIQHSWVEVLARHGASGWPAISSWTLPLRQARMWWRHRAWHGPAERIRWQGACGHFEGRVRRVSAP